MKKQKTEPNQHYLKMKYCLETPGKYNSFRGHPHLAARLRQNVTPVEAGVALQSLLRRDDLDPEARLSVYAAVKDRLEQRVAFPPEVTDGISDEQYVRNAVDVLFRQSP